MPDSLSLRDEALQALEARRWPLTGEYKVRDGYVVANFGGDLPIVGYAPGLLDAVLGMLTTRIQQQADEWATTALHTDNTYDIGRAAGLDWLLAALGVAPTTPEPPCPGCGMTAQVEPSRSEPGRFMCHGCVRVFDAGAAS